ncbi:MAG TPA: DUF87 domain-containing protein, partial [Thermoanaerobaculia bacterium]|nr:DUF87 domain-containing protein [Thermoanaerobaculia bacterium]
MIIDSRAVELTERFYRWELRGRGWATYPFPVPLEPPFQPFYGHWLGEGAPDDGKRQTWLSRLLERPAATPAAIAPGSSEALDERAREALDLPREAAAVGEWAELLIGLPETAKGVRTAQIGWLRSLSALSHHVSFELIGGPGRVEVRLAVHGSDVGVAVTQLRAHFPDVVVLPARATLADRWIEDGDQPFTALELGLASEFMVPLASGRGSEEPLLPVIAALADLGERELGVVQVLFEPTRAPWPDSVVRAVTAPGGGPFFADAPEITNLAREKLASPLFAVALRIAASADRAERAWAIVCHVAGGLAPLGNPRANELMPLHTEDLKILEADLRERTTHRSGMLLSAEELASLVQLPGAGLRVPELWRPRERTKPAPDEVTRGDGCFLGENEHHEQVVDVHLPDEARAKHVHILGASGTGKSTLLQRMILEDIEAGHGVGVLDPHGDLVDEIAGRIPESRLSDVVYLDPSREESSIGWNILRAETESEKELLASDLVGVFRRLSTSWGDQMTAVLGNAILVFLESSRGGTLEDLRRFLVDAKFRSEFLESVADDHA